MEIPFIGGSYEGRDIQVNAQRTVNWYPNIDKTGGKSILTLLPTPGLTEFCDIGSVDPVRQMKIASPTALYAVCGNTLYSINTAGTASAITGSLSVGSGIAYMEFDGTYMMVGEPGVDVYLYDTVGGGTLAVISDADFPTPQGMTWQDGYLITVKDSSGRFHIPTQYDPTAWDANDYATAESDPYNLSQAKSHMQNVWLFGNRNTEIWYNSGDSSFTFDRIQGAVIPYGIGAQDSVVSIAGRMFWITETKQVVMATGFTPEIISNDSIEYQLSRASSLSTVRSYGYAQEGHIFYVIVIPARNQTWVYDLKTQMWHERRSYPLLQTGVQDQHRGQCYAYFNNKHLVGDYLNGKIYEMDLGTYTDDSNAIIRERTTQFIQNDGKEIFFRKLHLECVTGVGLITGQGSDPQIMLQYSDDGGRTWSNELWRSLGKIGEYKAVVEWYRLGSAKGGKRTFKIKLSDPVRTTITNAFVEIDSI